MHSIIETNHLHKQYGIAGLSPPAVNNLDLTIEPGKFSVLMGPSGSGKSTLLYLLSGLENPSSGKIQILGQNICGQSESQLAKFRRKNIGFVFQDHNLIHQLSIKENIMIAGYLTNRDKQVVLKRITLLLSQVGIEDLADRLPSEVSGGESQRCAIVRALVNHPKILFADEPTGNLNSQSSEVVLKCFHDLHSSGQSILMATHDITAATYGDEIIYLRDGNVIDRLDLDQIGSANEKKDKIMNWLENLGW